MKHTGTIEIDCGDETCGSCLQARLMGKDYCYFFRKDLNKIDYYEEEIKMICTGYQRLPECLETFKPEISEGKVRQIMAGGSGIEAIKKALENK